MDLTEVFEQLYYGELSQTGIGNNGTSGVKEEDYPRLINYINLAILALHKRFVLYEDEMYIQLDEGVTNYDIIWERALTNSGSVLDPKYIIDSIAAPFTRNKFLKILTVWSELGDEYIVNPTHLEGSLETVFVAYTPQQTVLQIPYPGSEHSISIIYQAAPVNIPTTTTDLTTTVRLPEVLLDPLLAFIADRYFSTIPPNKEETVIYPSKFEKACAQIDVTNLVNHFETYGSNRFRRNGWQ